MLGLTAVPSFFEAWETYFPIFLYRILRKREVRQGLMLLTLLIGEGLVFTPNVGWLAGQQ